MYKKFALTLSINAIIMFLLTYVMIDRINHFYLNINKVYMTLLMVAPMVIIMLVVMQSMYKNKRVNYILIAAASGLFILCFFLARTQTPVGNQQFLRSMIPHHSSAILMCQQAAITDPEIITLCDQIVRSQEEEITQMQAIFGPFALRSAPPPPVLRQAGKDAGVPRAVRKPSSIYLATQETFIT